VTLKIYLEDLVVGEVFECGGRTVSREEILAFAREFDPQPFHVDEEAARRSLYGGIIASGWHTASLCMRMVVDGLTSRVVSLGSPGVDAVRWPRPVRPGDTLRVRAVCLEARPSRSKPDRGLARFRYEVYNQDDALVMSMEGMALVARRPGPDA
jgi:acyl dehydratase